MQLTSEAVPGVSLGGITLGSRVDDVLSMLKLGCEVDLREGIAVVNGGQMMIGFDSNRSIHAVECTAAIKVRFEDKLWPGMSVQDVLNTSKRQTAWGGCVVVDGIDGIGLPLPRGFDDFERLTDFLATDHVFETLTVFRCFGDGASEHGAGLSR